jgi:hypothetical protein
MAPSSHPEPITDPTEVKSSAVLPTSRRIPAPPAVAAAGRTRSATRDMLGHGYPLRALFSHLSLLAAVSRTQFTTP